MQSIKKDIH